MKKMITVYTNKKTNTKFQLVPELMYEDKMCLENMETGEQKFYAQSTLKRNFWKTEEEIEVATPNADEFEPALRANLIRSAYYREEGGATSVKENKSYIGINYNNKSVAQLSFGKKRLSLSLNKAEMFGYLESFEREHRVLELINRCFYKEAPAKYGWRMDIEIDVTDLTNDEIVDIIDIAILARIAVAGRVKIKKSSK